MTPLTVSQGNHCFLSLSKGLTELWTASKDCYHRLHAVCTGFQCNDYCVSANKYFLYFVFLCCVSLVCFGGLHMWSCIAIADRSRMCEAIRWRRMDNNLSHVDRHMLTVTCWQLYVWRRWTETERFGAALSGRSALTERDLRWIRDNDDDLKWSAPELVKSSAPENAKSSTPEIVKSSAPEKKRKLKSWSHHANLGLRCGGLVPCLTDTVNIALCDSTRQYTSLYVTVHVSTHNSVPSDDAARCLRLCGTILHIQCALTVVVLCNG